MKILNYSTLNVTPDNVAYGSLSGEHLLNKSKCFNINSSLDSIVVYADKAVCKRLNRGMTTTIGGENMYEYTFYLYVDKTKFHNITDYLTTNSASGSRFIAFNTRFNGCITEFIPDSGEADLVMIGVNVFSPDDFNADELNLVLSDNAIIITNESKTKNIASNLFASSISEKIDTARYGSFGRIYNSRVLIDIEFSPIRKSFSDGAEFESDLMMSKLPYLDLGLYNLTTLNIVNRLVFSNIIRTINTKEIRTAKVFYLMNLNQSVLVENNSYKFNIKALLI